MGLRTNRLRGRDAYRGGRLQGGAYVEALLTRADATRSLNVLLVQDRAALLEGARAVDLRRAAGLTLGPLAGVPLLVKDNIDTARLPTTAATPAMAANRPARDAPALAALFEAGDLLFGKSNMDELAFGNTGANDATGAIRNPYGLDRIPGGSSGGTAAGIAARISPAGLGTGHLGFHPHARIAVRDRRPASFGRKVPSGRTRAGKSYARHHRPDGSDGRRRGAARRDHGGNGA